MTTKYQNFSVHYFLIRSLFLGIGFSLIVGTTKQDSIFSFIVGTIIGVFFIFLINKMQEYKGNKTLDEILKEMTSLGIFLRFMLILFGLILLIEGLTSFQVFATNFLLIRSPSWFITIPIIYLILKISDSGITTIFRVAACLFPISLTLTLFSLFGLFSYSDICNIMPLFVSKPFTIMKSIFYYCSLSVSPSILLLISNRENNQIIPSYLLASFTLIVKVFLIIGIVGPILAAVYRYPEYIILKEIKHLNFIEKIENIVALSWIFDHFIYLAVSSVFVKELLPKKGNKIIHASLIITIYFLAFLVFGKYYQNELTIYYYIPIIIFAIFIVVLPILFFYLKKNKTIT